MNPALALLLLPAAAGFAVTTPAAAAQDTERVSVDSAGNQALGYSSGYRITPDGRYVSFSSGATNLVAGDTNGAEDVFVHDRWTGTTERVSVSSAGVQGNSTSTGPVISADGRYVAFYSKADVLVPGDTNGQSDVFLHDRLLHTTERMSTSAAGVQGDQTSLLCSISADGRYVAFQSWATNLVAGDLNGMEDVFLKDRVSGAVTLVSIGSAGGQGNGPSNWPDVNADGTRVVFLSEASNLIASDTNNGADVFVRDLATATTRLVHVSSAGVQGNNATGPPGTPSIDAAGRYVAYATGSDNLVANDTNGAGDVFVHDLFFGMTERVSVTSGGAQANDISRGGRLSESGRFVTFESRATDLVPGDTNFDLDAFLHDRESGVTERVSVAYNGAQASDESFYADVSLDGRWVVFTSHASNLLNGFDTNGSPDVFVRDRGADPGSITLHGGGLVHEGSPAELSWSGAPTTGLWWLAYSPTLNGTVVGGYPVAIGQPLTVLALGPASPSGSGTFTSGPIPVGAAGKLVHLELAARDQFGTLYDSNTVSLLVW